jgi:hypothetical protein
LPSPLWDFRSRPNLSVLVQTQVGTCRTPSIESCRFSVSSSAGALRGLPLQGEERERERVPRGLSRLHREIPMPGESGDAGQQENAAMARPCGSGDVQAIQAKVYPPVKGSAPQKALHILKYLLNSDDNRAVPFEYRSVAAPLHASTLCAPPSPPPPGPQTMISLAWHLSISEWVKPIPASMCGSRGR